MKQHTPAPWFLNERYEAVVNKDGKYIAMWATDCGDPIAPEDLKLIAAAPEMLEALEGAVKAMKIVTSSAIKPFIERAESAIKKATE